MKALWNAIWNAESASWYFVPTLIGSTIPLLTLPALTSVLDPAEYGAWVLSAIFGTFISGLGNLGFTIAYDRNFFEYTEPRLQAALLWGTSALVSGLLLMLLILSWIGKDIVAERILRIPNGGGLVFWTAAAISVGSIKQYFLLYFRNRGEARRYALFSVDESVLSAIFTVGFVFALRVGPVGLAWGPLLASTLVLLALLRTVSREVPFVLSAVPINASVRISYLLLPRMIFGAVGAQFDKWAIGILGGTGALGVYAIGQKLANTVFLVATALENKFQPRTYQLMFENSPDAGARIGALLTPFAYLTAGCGLGLALVASEAVALLTSPAYAVAAAICYILLVRYTLMFFGKLPTLIYAKKIRLLTTYSIASMSVTAFLTGIGAMAWGGLGAAVGATLSGILGTSVFVWLCQRTFRIEFEIKRLSMYFGIVVAACGLMLLGYWAKWGMLIMAPVKLVLVVAYGWVGWQGGIFAPIGLLLEARAHPNANRAGG